MEILAKSVEYGEFYFTLILVGLFGLLFLIIGIGLFIHMIVEKYFDLNGISGTIVCTGLGVLMSFALFNIWQDGENVIYKAMVTDFNEVYNNGYKVVGEEGKLYLLEKVSK
jgi:hypothetical protein